MKKQPRGARWMSCDSSRPRNITHEDRNRLSPCSRAIRSLRSATAGSPSGTCGRNHVGSLHTASSFDARCFDLFSEILSNTDVTPHESHGNRAQVPPAPAPDIPKDAGGRVCAPKPTDLDLEELFTIGVAWWVEPEIWEGVRIQALLHSHC